MQIRNLFDHIFCGSVEIHPYPSRVLSLSFPYFASYVVAREKVVVYYCLCCCIILFMLLFIIV